MSCLTRFLGSFKHLYLTRKNMPSITKLMSKTNHTSVYDMNTEEYKDFYNKEAERFGFRGSHLSLYLEKVIKVANVKRGEKVLDIGCGGGVLLKTLSGLKAESLGIDISNIAVRDASHYGTVILGDADNLPLNKNSFDVVILSEVLEHLKNPENVLSEIHKILNSGGRLILCVPTDRVVIFYKFVWGLLDEAFRDKGHLNDFSSPDKLKRVLNKKKWKVVKTEFVIMNFPILPFLAFPFYVENKILFRRRKRINPKKVGRFRSYSKYVSLKLFKSNKFATNLVFDLRKIG